jgi:hypothetical protein
LAVLGDLLKRRNHVNGGVGGQPQLTVRSASLSTGQLAEAHQLVLSTNSWSAVTTEAVTRLDGIVPSADALQAERESNRFGGGLFRQPDWTRFMSSPPTARRLASVPIIFQMLQCDRRLPRAIGARISSLSMTVPVRASRTKIDGCCRADGGWPALSRHHWLVSRHRPRRLPRRKAAMGIWQSLPAEITPARRSRFRRPTKRCNTRWRRTVQAQPIGADSHPSKLLYEIDSNSRGSNAALLRTLT